MNHANEQKKVRCWTPIFSIFFFLVGSICDAREVLDATKTKVRVNDHPLRIITLAPSLGELVADLLGENSERLVGVSENSDYPPALKRVTSIGPYHQFNMERVIALKPDLILATTDGNPKDKTIHLRELGFPVVVVDTEDFAGVQDSIRIVGTALGVPSLGMQMAAQLQTGIDRIQKKSKNHSKLNVLLQVGDQPLVVVGKRSFLHSAVEVLGARNIYSEAEAHYPRPSIEDVLHRNPDVIVVMALGNDMRVYEQMANRWKQFLGINAVKNHRVHLLKSDSLLRPSLRFLEGLSLLDQLIYGKG